MNHSKARKDGDRCENQSHETRTGKKGRFCTVINCMDGRVQLPVIRFLQKRFNAEFVDSITEAGPNLILSDDTNRGLVQLILDRVKISVECHHSRGIAVVGHHDCAGNPSSREDQLVHLQKAIDVVHRTFTRLEVIGLWVDDNWDVHEI